MRIRVEALLAVVLTAPMWGQSGVIGGAPAAPVVKAPPTLAQQVDGLEKKLLDWPALGRYAADNAKLALPAAGEQRVVFYGDSITDAWGRRGGSVFFPGKPYVNRGISGQTTPQMLVRFQQDVVALKPAVVVILAGTNDVAGNTGPETPEMVMDNFESMVAVAKANGIKVVITSILPASKYPWKLEVQNVAEKIRTLNVRLKAMCDREGLVYVDYYSAMTNAEGGLDPDLSGDGVHPTAKGYTVMAPLAQAGIDKALGK